MADYRFLRTHDGVTRFARVTVVATESEAWSTALSEDVRQLGAVYGQAIQEGLALAIAEQNRQNGQKFAIVVTSLLETAIDTSTDAIECAVAVATWKSFGEEKRDVTISFAGGRWSAAFEQSQVHSEPLNAASVAASPGVSSTARNDLSPAVPDTRLKLES